MTQTISAQSLADINANAAALEVSLDGRGHFAGLSNTAKQTLRRLGALKEVLGQNAADFRIVLEQHKPAEGAIISAGEDCGNSWHIAGVQAMSAKPHVIDSLRSLTGVEPASNDGRTVAYNADQLDMMLAALAHSGPSAGRY